jgi:hypothetical protein
MINGGEYEENFFPLAEGYLAWAEGAEKKEKHIIKQILKNLRHFKTNLKKFFFPLDLKNFQNGFLKKKFSLSIFHHWEWYIYLFATTILCKRSTTPCFTKDIFNKWSLYGFMSWIEFSF